MESRSNEPEKQDVKCAQRRLAASGRRYRGRLQPTPVSQTRPKRRQFLWREATAADAMRIALINARVLSLVKANMQPRLSTDGFFFERIAVLERNSLGPDQRVDLPGRPDAFFRPNACGFPRRPPASRGNGGNATPSTLVLESLQIDRWLQPR